LNKILVQELKLLIPQYFSVAAVAAIP